MKVRQTKKIIYFGTDGCLGHNPKGINCKLSNRDYNELKLVDRIDEDVLRENGGWFIFRTSCDIYTCFSVPHSLDDKRPGSKSIVMVEGGEVIDVIAAIHRYAFLRDKFKKLNERYELNIDFLNQIG